VAHKSAAGPFGFNPAEGPKRILTTTGDSGNPDSAEIHNDSGRRVSGASSSIYGWACP